MVGNADINRRVVIRAYAPCLAWKTIFHAGDNSCRLVCLSLFSFPFLSSLSLLYPCRSWCYIVVAYQRLSRFHPSFSPPLSSQFLRLVSSYSGGHGPQAPLLSSRPLKPPLGISSSVPPCQNGRTKLYEPRVLLVPACCARPRVPAAKLKLARSSGRPSSSNKCLAISDIRQPDASNLYGPDHGPPLGKNYFHVSLTMRLCSEIRCFRREMILGSCSDA